MAKSSALTALSFIMGFFFIFMGSIKVTPAINQGIFQHLVWNEILSLYYCLMVIG